MSINYIDPNHQFKAIMVKGTSGNALNKIEYICEADPGASTSGAVWRIRKLVYDSAGFNTQILWANGNSKFDKIQTSYASYTYSA